MARPNPTPNPTPTLNYRSLYRWAPTNLLDETSSFTSFESITTYKESETCPKSRVFGKEDERFVKVMPYGKGEPVCADKSSDFCFIYSTAFKRLKLCLPLTGFERALLTEVNVALTQLHPNSWAFVRAFSILCDYFGHVPSVDVFLHFFEAKSPGKKLWVSFNGVDARVMCSLFQQSYKGFKGKFLKIYCSKFVATLLDRFPLYCVQEPELKKPRCLEELPTREREVCEFFSKLGAVFSTIELIKLEYNLKSLKAYIGTPFPLFLLMFLFTCMLYWFKLLCFFIFLCRHGAQC